MIKNRDRQKMQEQEPDVRAKNFEEVSGGFDEETAIFEAERCLQCKNAPCVQGCPVNVKIPEFIALLKEKKYAEAGAKINETNSLPSVCGRVCPQENQCEARCVRAKMEGPISIGGLERFVGDMMLQSHSQPEVPAQNGKKAAIVGGGPSGLTCASELRKAGFDVTIYEAFHKLGGVLVYGIPEFRLPKDDVVQKEIDKVLALGVKVELNTVIGKTITMEELIEENDAVFIGSGAGLPRFLGIEGEALRGVYSANEYLTRVNLMKAYKSNSSTPLPKAKNTVVVGGGNVAMDGARTALRLGSEVTIVYRRSKNEMPARAEEARHAEEEGVIFHNLANPVKVLGEEGKVVGIECVEMKLGEPDDSGRRRPIPIEGSNFIIPCDTVIVAVGTSPNPIITGSFKELSTTKRGTLVVEEETNQTSVENVYAGGDAVTGAATVILAMGAGRKAAHSIIDKIKD